MNLSIRTSAELSTLQRQRKRAVALGLVGLMAIALSTASIWDDDTMVRRLVEALGLVLIVVSVVGRAWCSLYIGGRKAAELVVTGPYSLSRNPLYFFSLLGALGMGAQSGSISLGLLFLAAAVAIFLPLIGREESYLAQAMPGAFDAYRLTTPRLLPRLSLWRSPEEITVRPVFFSRTLLDGVVMVLAWPIFEGIEVLQRAGVFPVLMRWP